MARTQFTFTFRNAEPGASVTFSDDVFSSPVDQVADGPALALDASRSVAVWSDAAELTATWIDAAGTQITAEASVAIPVVVETGGVAGASQPTPDTDVWPVVSETADFTAADQHVYLVDATAGNIAVTVPHAAGSRSLIVRVDSAAHTVTLTPDSGEIDASYVSVTLNLAGAALHLVGDGTDVWRLNPAAGGDTTFRNLTVGVGGTGLLNVTDDLLHSGDAAGFFGHAVHVQPVAIDDATDAPSVITQLNLALAALRDLGLIAT